MLRTNFRMPSFRGLIKIAGAVAIGAAATTVFAAPASAWDIDITGKPVCDVKTGTVTVTWTITNDPRFPDWQANYKVTDFTPDGSVVTPLEGIIPANGSTEVVQTNVPGGKGALIKVKVVWPGKGGDTKWFESDKVKTPCVKESPSPSPSPSKSTSPSPSPSASKSTGGGGGGGSTSPTPSTPSLPVTGSNVPIYAGSALGLVGVGGVLFFVARRRRIRFDA